MKQTFQRSDIYRDFDLSFSANPLTEDLGVKKDVNAINQSLRSLLSTGFYERPFRPDVGTNLFNLLFELATPITIAEIRSAIMEVIYNYEPRVTVIDIKIGDLSEMNAYKVSIEYRINSINQVGTFDVTLKRLR